MLYCSLGSQPVVSSVLKNCSLNLTPCIFDNVGDLYFETLLNCIDTQFKDFFPPKNKLQILPNISSISNNVAYSVVKDKRNNTLFYDILPLGKSIDGIYKGAKTKYERLGCEFIQAIQNTKSAIFVRQMIDDNRTDTMELQKTLKWNFPSCKFYLKHGYAGIDPKKCFNFWKQELRCDS